MCLMYMYAEILIKISIFYKNDTGQSEKNIILSNTCIVKNMSVQRLKMMCCKLISIIYLFNVHVC